MEPELNFWSLLIPLIEGASSPSFPEAVLAGGTFPAAFLSTPTCLLAISPPPSPGQAPENFLEVPCVVPARW